MEKRKICIVTSARADWGLLQPVAAELRRAPQVELQIVATNMHLMPEYGMTVNEIEADGFTVSERVPMDAAGDSPLDKALATSRCMAGMAEAFGRLRPDIILLLGDRYEMLAVADNGDSHRPYFGRRDHRGCHRRQHPSRPHQTLLAPFHSHGALSPPCDTDG